MECFGEVDKHGNPTWVTSEQVLSVWLFLLNHIDPTLRLERTAIPNIQFYGFDTKNRHLNTPGYGLFEYSL